MVGALRARVSRASHSLGRLLRDKLAPNLKAEASLPACAGVSIIARLPIPNLKVGAAGHAFLALLDRVQATPAHLVGFSDGGEYELVMAELQPSAVRSVVTWGSAGKLEAPPEMIEMFASVVDNPIEPMKEFSDYLKAAYGEANARAMVQGTAKAFREIIAAGGDISCSRASEITCPALLLTGEQDIIAPPPLVSQMAGAIRNGEFMEVKDAGHEVHAAKPEWLAQTIVDWLAKH